MGLGKNFPVFCIADFFPTRFFPSTSREIATTRKQIGGEKNPRVNRLARINGLYRAVVPNKIAVYVDIKSTH